MTHIIPKALTIAGSDSGGGAGIQADLKTFSALGVYGTSVITAITAQNTRGVSAVHNIPLKIISAQINAVLSDIGADAIKIGMLSNSEIIKTVAHTLRNYKIDKIVLDPVMIATSGDRLLEESAIESLKKLLMPLSLVVTPNIPEAELLVGFKIRNDEDVRCAGRELLKHNANAVLMKGAHLITNKDTVVDIFMDKKDELQIENRRIKKDGHGTGCTLSSAIASFLAKGFSLREAVKNAIGYTHTALEQGIKVGECNYVLKHFWKFT